MVKPLFMMNQKLINTDKERSVYLDTSFFNSLVKLRIRLQITIKQLDYELQMSIAR